MEPLIRQEKEVATYVPYRRAADGFEFFLQKRDTRAPVDANMFGTFGGALERGEETSDALRREVHEELGYEPLDPRFFAVFQRPRTRYHVFIEEVAHDFESRVHVHEGEYGKFLTIDQMRSQAIAPITNLIVNELSAYLAAA